jgi:hypothetical protein
MLTLKMEKSLSHIAQRDRMSDKEDVKPLQVKETGTPAEEREEQRAKKESSSNPNS